MKIHKLRSMDMASFSKDTKKIEAKIIAKAWKDPKFKALLLKDPAAALKEMGFKVPKHIHIKAVEDSEKEITLVLPPSPTSVQELSEAEVEQLVGGAAMYCTWSTNHDC